MCLISRAAPLSAILAATVALLLAAAGPAEASSIVYLKDGNVWLSSPDGARGYQVTFDGGWDSPSEADDGTIMATRDRRLYRMSPSGRLLGGAVPTVLTSADRSTSSDPAGVRLSPDGSHQAYWREVYTSPTTTTPAAV